MLKPVTVGRNLGNSVEIEVRRVVSDRLIDNPQESTQTGDAVRIAGADAKTPTLAAAGKSDPAPAKSD